MQLIEDIEPNRLPQEQRGGEIEPTPLLEAALRACRGVGDETTRFLIFDPKEEPLRFEQLLGMGSMELEPLAGAELLILVIGSPMEVETFRERAAYVASQLLLEARGQGYGSSLVWLGGLYASTGQEVGDNVRQLFSIPYQLEVVALIGLSRYPGEEGQDIVPTEELSWEHVYIDRYPEEEA